MRLGQRTIQRASSAPIILTGFKALNKRTYCRAPMYATITPDSRKGALPGQAHSVCNHCVCVGGGGGGGPPPLWTSRHNSLAFLMYYSAPNLHAPVRCLCIDGCVQSSAGTCIPPTCNWVGPRSCTPMAWPTKSSTTTTTVRRAYTHTPVCRLCLGPCSLDASLHVRLCRLRSRPICFARFL